VCPVLVQDVAKASARIDWQLESKLVLLLASLHAQIPGTSRKTQLSSDA
jgi:hypothetical protein